MVQKTCDTKEEDEREKAKRRNRPANYRHKRLGLFGYWITKTVHLGWYIENRGREMTPPPRLVTDLAAADGTPQLTSDPVTGIGHPFRSAPKVGSGGAQEETESRKRRRRREQSD